MSDPSSTALSSVDALSPVDADLAVDEFPCDASSTDLLPSGNPIVENVPTAADQSSLENESVDKQQAETDHHSLLDAEEDKKKGESLSEASSSEVSSDSSSSDSSSSDDESSICQSVMDLSDHEEDMKEPALKTKNEIPELPPIERIHVEIPIEEPLICVGRVDQIIQDNLVIIAADNSGDYQVLDMDSVLLTKDKKPIGKIYEVFGRVQQPLYSIRIGGKEDIDELALEINTPVYYIQNLVQMVFTQTLKAQKGSDASNLHDEEVGDNEAEFSDDEKEAEHKRQMKKRKNPSNDSIRKFTHTANQNQRHRFSNQNLDGNSQRLHQYQQPFQQQMPHNTFDQYTQDQYSQDQYTQYYYQMMHASFNQQTGHVYNYQTNQYPYGYPQGVYNSAYQMGSQVNYMPQNSTNQMGSQVNYLPQNSNTITPQHMAMNQVKNEEIREDGEVEEISLYDNIFQQ